MNRKTEKSEKSEKSTELERTLSQLESAIKDWESVLTDKDRQESQQQIHAPQLAQSLVRRLREQLDELSD